MCGITGIYAFNEIGRFNMINLSAATEVLSKRGLDSSGLFNDYFVGLGHRRLSILDVSDLGRQPMRDDTGRYIIVFNGEIYNFREIRRRLVSQGASFKSETDTEVLLKLYIHEGEECLRLLNGFFAFAIYDLQEQSLFIARDRIGIKPLLYYHDEDKFIFGSEIKSLLAYGIAKELDYHSLYQYLQLNYIPAPDAIFKGVKKLLPGHCIKIRQNKFTLKEYYQIPYHKEEVNHEFSYDRQQEKLIMHLENAVQKRLISDVPLGAFLSGGIDSSAIVALASRHTPHLNTFSIGYKDEPFFDETGYARLVAKKFNTEHTIFSLTNNDLYKHLHSILDYMDEPFADSSAIPVYILSKHTKEVATVALSGDGADEIFSGYNKHMAAYKAMNGGFMANAVKNLLPVWNLLPKSRNNKFSNKIRQLKRFGEGMKLNDRERYWQWAAIATEAEASALLSDKSLQKLNLIYCKQRKEDILSLLGEEIGINDLLYADSRFVLPNDMLVKVDMMSMANGLEVRVPFLDHEVVQFAFQLPADYKINDHMKKRILQDAFKNILPPELYNRPKQGFEVPLLKWFKTELRALIEDDLLKDSFIIEQEVFNAEYIKKLKKQLYSSDTGDTYARIWALVVFQWWWKKYF